MADGWSRITVDYLARVEGETGLDILVADGQVRDIELRLFEPPRVFEGFMVGRRYDEVPEIASRICGICPHPHQIAALTALERALDVEVSEQTVILRRLIHLGDWIQSHALHIYMLALPDYVGCDSVIDMAAKDEYREDVARALRLKRLGNDIQAAVGGRDVHPVTLVIGGFSQLPDERVLAQIRERLVAAMADANHTVDLVAGLEVPQFVRDCEHVALRSASGYPVNEGRLASTMGLDVDQRQYRDWLVEHTVSHSNARHSRVRGRGSLLVGPIARINLNHDLLTPLARRALDRARYVLPARSMYRTIVARAIELVHAIDECSEIIDQLDLRSEQPEPVPVRAGRGQAVVEAPRGICSHEYEVDDEGVVVSADIVAPTSRNAHNIELDLRQLVPGLIDMPHDRAIRLCEMLVRAYDPCFSCSVHGVRVWIRYQ